MMKRFLYYLSVVVGVTLLLIIGGCSNQQKNEKGELRIVTSFYPMYVATLNITSDVEGVTVRNMTPPQTGCLHDYQLNPGDLKKLNNADVFVANGGGMESFLKDVTTQLPHIKMINASKGMEFLPDSLNKDEVNAHIWVSISGAIGQVQNISKQLIAIDPTHKDQYEKNTKEYVGKLEALRTEMHEELSTINNRKIITFHEAFPYFAEEFGLDIVEVVERDPGTEPSAGELAQLIDKVKKSKVTALFAEPQYSKEAAEAIAKETDAVVYILDPVVAKKADGNKEGYLEAMKKNLVTLKEALK